jgi:hypothetical protein
MPEKDYKKVEEKVEQQTVVTTQPTPEMSLVMNALTGVFGTLQKNLEAGQPLSPETPPPFEGAAKTAVEKFNDILAGLQLKHPLSPPFLEPITIISQNEVELRWNISDETGNPSGFKIMRAQDPNPNDFAQVGEQLPASERKYRDVTVIGKTRYLYKVVALTSRGEIASLPKDVTP